MKTWVNPRLPTLLSSCGLGTSVSYAQKNLWVACTVAPAYVVLIPLLLMSPALMEDAIILPQLSLAGSDFSSLFFRPTPAPGPQSPIFLHLLSHHYNLGAPQRPCLILMPPVSPKTLPTSANLLRLSTTLSHAWIQLLGNPPSPRETVTRREE